MGNISGIIGSDIHYDDSVVKSMLKVMFGKEETIYRYNGVILGSLGDNNYSISDGVVDLIFDGTIYNIKELRCNLIELGHEFQSQNTSEVLLFSYNAWGHNFVKKLNGSFAIAIVDRRKDRLLLFRDRLGERGLYWFRSHNHFLFASNLKGLLATGLIPRTISEDGFSLYFTLGYVPQDMTHIKGVNKLLPAYYLDVNLRNKKLSIQPYWSYSSYFNKKPPEKQFCNFLENALKLRVNDRKSLQMISDEDLGSQALSKILSARLEKTSSISKASIQNVNDFLVPMIWHLGEPVVNPSLINFWNTMRQFSNTPKDFFIGFGSDILLSTCRRYFIDMSSRFQNKKNIIPSWLFHVIGFFSKKMAFKILKRGFHNSYQSHYFSNIAIFNNKDLRKASPTLHSFFHMTSFVKKFHNMFRCQQEWLKPLYFDVKTILPDGIIVPFNIIGEVHGATLHNPFLDHNIVELLAKIYSHQEWQSDNLPLKDLFPESEIFFPEDNGLYDLQTWMSTKLMAEILDLLLDGLLVKTGLISKKWMEKALKKKETSFLQLWSILCLEVWYRLFIHSPIRSEQPHISIKDFLK